MGKIEVSSSSASFCQLGSEIGGHMNTLLSVSGVIPSDLEAQVADGKRPQADYVEMARQFGADLVDFAKARSLHPRLGPLIERIGGPHLLLAWTCFRLSRRYDTVVTDGEQIGLPLALLTRFSLRRRMRHLMIVHVLSVRKKVHLARTFRLTSQIDMLVVYSSWQKMFIERELHVPAHKVVLSTFMVDTSFFSPDRVSPNPRNAVCSAGLEHRDYATLIDATEALPIDVIVASGSPWSKRPDLLRGRDIPANVHVSTLTLFELRQLYADCKFVVVPLSPVLFQAGVTTILEAMAMGKAVICSKTPGQCDVIQHERTGLYVEPGDPEALRAAIERLIDDPELTERLGAAGRAWVERADIQRYAAGLAKFVVQAPSPITGDASQGQGTLCVE